MERVTPEIEMDEEPMDRLTELCAKLSAHLEEIEPGLACIVFIDDKRTRMSGGHYHGYDDNVDALLRACVHTRTFAEAQGIDLKFLVNGSVWPTRRRER